jgi:predicted RNase H-like HicB family nuclease
MSRRVGSEDENMLYPIAILPGNDQHAWGVEVPDIPGCFSAGDDLDDAMAMAREAIEGHLEILAEDGSAIPIAQRVTVHAANPEFAGCTWAVVDIDVTKYMGKAEKLNITLPGHLLNRIDAYVRSHPDQKSRSGFLATAALKILQSA